MAATRSFHQKKSPMQPREITLNEAIATNNIAAIQKFKPEELLEFKDATYHNVVLLAARDAHVETVKEILRIIETHFGKEERDKLLFSADSLHRPILALASIANNAKLIQYLHAELGLSINDRGKAGSPLWHSIKRNAAKAFDYLLQNGAKFTQEELGLITACDAFKTYFNSPESFLRIIQSGNMQLFHLIIRHIRTQPDAEQALFSAHIDGDGRHALCLAAALDRHNMLPYLSRINFNIESRDAFDRRALYYLAKNSRLDLFLKYSSHTLKIDPAEARFVSQNRNNFLLNTKVSKKSASTALTNDVNNVKQVGRLPKAYPIEKQKPYRSFSSERERQLLRQAATQLYFSLSIEGLVEIQIMHLEFNGKHNLFIAANKPSITSSIPALIASRENLSNILTTAHLPKDKEGKIRSARYANKLAARAIYAKEVPNNQGTSDKERTRQVATLLKNGMPYSLPISAGNNYELSTASQALLKHVFLNNNNHIYILVLNGYSSTAERHAEEFLTDIADYAAVVAKESEMKPYSCIGGKKRPCMGCTGRMMESINQYGSYPGRFWIHTIQNQSHSAARNTLNTLLTSPAHVSVCKDGMTLANDYDSGSDSDEEYKVNGLSKK